MYILIYLSLKEALCNGNVRILDCESLFKSIQICMFWSLVDIVSGMNNETLKNQSFSIKLESRRVFLFLIVETLL